MLLIRRKTTGEIYFPKGRKNIGETLEDAAVRETYEETGFRVTLLSLPTPTLATPPTATQSGSETSAITEPVAVSQRTTDRQLKIIFLFAAKGNSPAIPDAGTQQEGEDFEPLWVKVDDAVERLTFEDDRQIALYIINASDLVFSQ